jgi:stage II sporulation protein P
MNRWAQRAAAFATALLAAAGVACVGLRLPQEAAHKAAFAAAGFILPSGDAADFFSEEEQEGEGGSSSPASSAPPAASGAPASSSPSSGGASSVAASSAAPSSQPAAGQKALEMCIDSGGKKIEGFWVKNLTEKNAAIDFAQELKKQPAVKIRKNAGPQVLIYHTHTTEAYAENPTARTTDKTQSVCAVGDEIAKQLTAAGIGVLHDTTYHDYPAYNGSYDRSRATMQKDLKKYPGIQVTLDIHRDAMHRSDGMKLKPTALVNGKKAAQVMIISGCDDKGALGYPNWEYNLRLALRLQKAMTAYQNLGRPLDFCARKYNQDMTRGSLLVEVGTDVNTLAEAKYAGELFGRALAGVLNGLT